MTISSKWTEGMISELLARREAGQEFAKIADGINKTYKTDFSMDAARLAYQRYKHLAETGKAVGDIKVLKEIARIKRSNSQVAKENRTILEQQNTLDDVIEQVKLAIKALPKIKVPAPPKKDAKKADVTVEMLVSDVHIGKITSTFNLEICRQRLRQYASLVIQEIRRKQAHYNVERLILNFLGDEIENATMHGIESMRGCEFANPEQVRYAIELFYQEIILAVAQLGIPVDVHCVPGNHSREGEKKTYQLPGKNSYSWIIYQTMKMLTEQAGLKQFTWTIPEGVYSLYSVYGANILVEHGDFISGSDKRALLGHTAKRSAQLGVVIHGIRIGHYHEYSCYDNGRAIVNGSVCGGDSFSEILGYSTIPVQVVTFYVRTASRDTPYYYSLPCYLNAGTKA